MSYITRHLLPGEEVLYDTRLSVWSFAQWWCIGTAALLGIFINHFAGVLIFIVGTVIMLACWLEWSTSEIGVTNMRVVVKTGWISRKTTEISLARVEGVEIIQSLSQRLLGYGNVLVSGVGSHKARVKDVVDPMEFRREFLTAVGRFEGKGAAESKGGTSPDGGTPTPIAAPAPEPVPAPVPTPTMAVPATEVKPFNERMFIAALADVLERVDDQWVVLDPAALIEILAAHKDHPAVQSFVQVSPAHRWLAHVAQWKALAPSPESPSH